MKLASGFDAGMGRIQEVCGAVSGGVLALGARFGHGEPAESEAQKKHTPWCRSSSAASSLNTAPASAVNCSREST